jgi:methylaspartate mutase epsilon subunit
MGGDLDCFVAAHKKRGQLVVQPRMGFGAVGRMRASLGAIAAADVPVVGTITLDSYTRVGDYTTPLQRLAAGEELNGYPLVSHPAKATRQMLDGVAGPAFPVQVRHGTALPQRVIERLIDVGLEATEGGPVSYCLPYSRVPLPDAVGAWKEGCRILAGETEHGHLESFGGCLLGQLCPPSLLVAMAVLEGCFFSQHGITSVSLSYAQGTCAAQDRGALRALRILAQRYLRDVTWHVVLYTYMGVFPRTTEGATALIADSARLAARTGCERLIVKTVSEAWQIPSVEENLAALGLASAVAADVGAAADVVDPLDREFCAEVLAEAESLIEAVLDLEPEVGAGLVRAFALGLLDIPYCLHAANAGRATGRIDERGALVWGSTGSLALPRSARRSERARLGSDAFYAMLQQVARCYDALAGEVAPIQSGARS